MRIQTTTALIEISFRPKTNSRYLHLAFCFVTCVLIGPAEGWQVPDTGRIISIAPPPTKTSDAFESKPSVFRRLPVLHAATHKNPQQDFLEDIPARDEPALKSSPLKRPRPPSAERPVPVPGPVDDPQPIHPRSRDDAQLLPSPSIKDEAIKDEVIKDEELLDDGSLDQRQKSVTPYPRPDFSTPAEPVVPLPIQRAPEEFRGFEPGSPGDWNLPEPRRIFPLPKVDVPAPPSLSPSQTPRPVGPFDSSQQKPNNSMHLSEHPGNYSDSPQFESLLRAGPVNFGSYAGSLKLGGTARSRVPAMSNSFAPDESRALRERLNSKRWQLQHARQLPTSNSSTPVVASQTSLVPYQPDDFAPVPYVAQPLDPKREKETYYGKLAVDTQRPWVEWWRPFYTTGMYEPGVPVLSDVNLLTPAFIVYGDYRTGVGVHRNNGQPVRSLASRLNLDMDLRLTGTERFHLFTGPLDHNGRFTRLDFSNDKVEFVEELDAQIDTAFFEGDLGAITGSWLGDDAPFDLPFTCGLVPLLYQNGIWMEDAIAGFAVGAPWKHNRALNWSNYEATFFAGFNQVTSPAFNNDNNAAAVYGTAWFIEAYNGYIETDYAYLDDLDKQDRSYHNAAIAYTRRYFGRISNSVRLIGNIGQSGPAINRTADGALLLFENSLISAQPSTLVPYWNCFVGSGRPQSVARAANAGGILRNTGINFETDGLTGYPTLNATASNSYGGALGLNVLSADFRKQLVFEFAALDTYGNPALSAAAGPEYAVGTRYQTALNNRLIWRVDLMNGWFDNAPDIYGTRTEIRWKF